MNWHPNFEDFFYGNVAKKEVARQIHLVRNEKAVTFKHPKVEAHSSLYFYIDLKKTLDVSAADISNREMSLPFDFRTIARLNSAIKNLGITKDDAATLMNMSLSNLMKLLAKTQKDVINPSNRVREEVELFLKLYTFLKEKLGKRYLVRAAMRESVPAFGNSPPIEFAKKIKNNRLLRLFGSFKRIYE